MNVGDLATVEQGEVRFFTVAFGSQLGSGETLEEPVIAAIDLWPYSPVPDTNAENIVLGAPTISGSNIIVPCGGYGSTGFLAGAVYSLAVSVTTSNNQTLTNYGQIICDPQAPATDTGGNGSMGQDASANQPTIPNVGSNFGSTGSYANFALIATLPANPFRKAWVFQNQSLSQVVLVFDDGKAATGQAPQKASVLSYNPADSTGGQGSADELQYFKGRVQAFSLNTAAQIALFDF